MQHRKVERTTSNVVTSWPHFSTDFDDSKSAVNRKGKLETTVPMHERPRDHAQAISGRKRGSEPIARLLPPPLADPLRQESEELFLVRLSRRIACVSTRMEFSSCSSGGRPSAGASDEVDGGAGSLVRDVLHADCGVRRTERRHVLNGVLYRLTRNRRPYSRSKQLPLKFQGLTPRTRLHE